MLSVATHRVPVILTARAALTRAYASSTKEGSVAQSREFGKKERAHEEEYTRRHDAELLRKLKSEIKQKEKEIAHLESKMKETETK